MVVHCWNGDHALCDPNVRFGSKADICSAKGHVRFTPESDAECVHSNVRYRPIANSCAASTIDQSSARSSTVGGTFRPSALAVFKLIMSSNLVDCSTGISPGFEPLRIILT